jgi:hypothetical protein
VLFKDIALLPVDETGDGGDSAVRAGILMLTTDQVPKIPYVGLDGLMVRHPIQVPWNNPYNCTRDQLLPLLAGLHQTGNVQACKRLFYSHLKRGFFCQNFERDFAGSTKYPWPHKVDGKWRAFDFADPLLPNHIGCLIIAGRIRWAYWFLPIAYLFHFVMLWGHAVSKHNEENQQIAECSIYKTLRAYVFVKPQWSDISYKYWADRREYEYHFETVNFIRRCTWTQKK